MGVIRHPLALLVFKRHQTGQLLGGEAVRIIDGAAGVGGGDDAGAEGHRLLDGVLGHVARARHRDPQAIEGLAAMGQHGVDKVEQAVAGGFRTNEAAAKGESLAGEDALGAVGELLHHARHVAHLAPAHPDVARRHVGVGPQVAIELQHEGLAEAHHFSFALALGIEVAAPLAAPHGQGGEGVLEGLLEGEEFQHREIHRGVEAHAALEGADGGAVLHPVAAIHLHLALVIHPAHPKLHQALGFHQSLQQAVLQVAGVALHIGPDGGDHLAHGLDELGLVRVAAGDLGQEGLLGEGMTHL